MIDPGWSPYNGTMQADPEDYGECPDCLEPLDRPAGYEIPTCTNPRCPASPFYDEELS